MAKILVDHWFENPVRNGMDVDDEPQPSTSSAPDPVPTKPIDAKTKDGLTALILACYKLDYALIELLVDNGADVNAVDKDGDSPIILLAMRLRSANKKKLTPTKDKSPKIHKVCL